MEFRFDAMLCSHLGNGNSGAGHVKCSCGPLVPHRCYTGFVARQRYQRGILRWSWNEVNITIRWGTAKNNCEKRYALF